MEFTSRPKVLLPRALGSSTLSNNMANVTTPGFKRDLAMFQARYSEADSLGLDTPGSHTLNDLGGGVMIRGTKTDYRRGPLKHTESPYRHGDPGRRLLPGQSWQSDDADAGG